MAALADNHQPRSVDRRFPTAASELPPPTQPLQPLVAVLRCRTLLGSRRHLSCMAALATGHQPRPVDRRFPIAASELPHAPQPPLLLSVVLRSRASLARFAARPAGGSGRQPSAAALGPPLPDRSLRAADDDATAATSVSGVSQPSDPWLASPPVLHDGSGRQPSAAAARGPPLPDRSLQAADAAATAATSRSGASQPSTSGSLRRSSCMAALVASPSRGS